MVDHQVEGSIESHVSKKIYEQNKDVRQGHNIKRQGRSTMVNQVQGSIEAKQIGVAG